MQRETDKSYEMYMKAYEEAKGQREVELMCLYEISKYGDAFDASFSSCFGLH